ncbi:YraN family protein [Singulisphaera rosea]
MNPRLRAILSRIFGGQGEREAARFLRRKGFRILLQGYRTPLGEVDLIARDGDTLVFVEVKARRHGEPAEAVTPEKQRRLTLAALQFLKEYDLLEQRSRFDVVAIVWPEGSRTPSIDHFANAFDAVGRGQLFR